VNNRDIFIIFALENFNNQILTIVKNKKNRMQKIVELVKTCCIGSQNELSEMLAKQGINVTQATLSRDLKSLKITKVATDHGNYMYIIPDSNELQNQMLNMRQSNSGITRKAGIVSMTFSGNFVVIKTRNGYATGLAYDIDMAHLNEILGTLAGADTVFAILREGVSHRQAEDVLNQFIDEE